MGRTSKFHDGEMDNLPDPDAEIPGTDLQEREKILLETATGHVRRGRLSDGRLAIDGVPIERATSDMAEADSIAEGNVPTDPEHEAKVNEALLESLKTAGYVEPSLAGITSPDEVPGVSLKGKKGGNTGGQTQPIKPPIRTHHSDRSRRDAQSIIASTRDPNVEPPKPRGR